MKFLFLFLFIFNIKSFSYINISPVTFDKRIDNMGQLQEYRLYNPMDYPIRYSIYLSDKGIEKSMKDWIEIYPQKITIKPGQSEVFKVYIKSPKGAPKGEYLTTIGIKELSIATPKIKKENGVKVLTHLKMDIAGYIGALSPKIFLKDFKVKSENNKLLFSGYIANVGERRGTLDFYLSKNKKDLVYIGNLRLLTKEKISADNLNQNINKFDTKFIENILEYKNLIIKDSLSNQILFEKKI